MRICNARLFPLLLLICLLAGCMGAVVDDRYSTLALARADRLFERGWLPDILPSSARDIRTMNDLDCSTSKGRFKYSDTDAAPFFRKLELGVPEHAPFKDWAHTVERYRRAGHVAWTYHGRGTWVFFCHAARDECQYVLWT